MEEQFVVFRLGTEEYAIDISQVREIIQYRSVTKLPDCPAYMEGVINLRGKVIPVIDLVLRLGIRCLQSDGKRVLVIETSGRDIGIIVDDVTEVLRLAHTNIEPSPALTAAGGYIRGIGKLEERLLILLNVSLLFGEAELEEMKKIS